MRTQALEFVFRAVTRAILAICLACGWTANAHEKPALKKQGTKEDAAMQTASSQLEHLFSLELKYQGPVELAPMGEKVGKLVGGGDGTLKGPKIKGTVRWSNYETTGQDEVCSLQVPGVIQTDDGARIQFEGREFAMPAADSPKRWSVAGVIRFRTEDDRYKWLNKVFALAKGTFDYESGIARWDAFIAM